MKRAAADRAEVRAVLRQARRVVKDQRDGILESCCLLDKKTLTPRRETLGDAAKPDVRRMERLLARIDRALGVAP
jgi:hypothetical protein